MNRKILSIYLLLQAILSMAAVGAAEAEVQLSLVPEGGNVFTISNSPTTQPSCGIRRRSGGN